MIIHGYYAHVPQHSLEDEWKLMLLWQRVWRAQGWETRVLNESHARQHPFFAEYDAAISKLPSVNPAGYERACWLRWLALTQVGGGWMSDFDVVPYASHLAILNQSAWDCGKLQMFQNCSPSLVFCGSNLAFGLCQLFATGKYGSKSQGQHFSDQYALEQLGEAADIQRHDLVKGFGDPGWETAPAVHYSNASMTPNHQPRWKHIPELRKL